MRENELPDLDAEIRRHVLKKHSDAILADQEDTSHVHVLPFSIIFKYSSFGFSFLRATRK